MRRKDSQPPVLSTIYVGSIPFDWTENNLKAVVCALGNVLDVRLGFDHIGKNKGFAFVEFETPQQAVNAAQILTKVQIVMPNSGQLRRFRTEVKETFRSNEQKSIIPLNPADLPAGVQFPPELISKTPQLQWASQGSFGAPKGVDTLKGASISRGASNTPPSTGGAINLGTIAPPSANNTLPEKWLKATQNLALPKKLPFSTEDKINETLSQFPPPQLIELIANLKNILNSPNAGRATEVFQLTPNLAVSVTQALLLMGLIDEEVIQEAMKAGSGPVIAQSGSISQQQPTMYSSSLSNATHGHNMNPPPSGQYMHSQNQRTFVQDGYTSSTSFGVGQGFTQNYQQSYSQQGVPNQQSQNFGRPISQNQNSHHSSTTSSSSFVPSKWPHLPPSAQVKLASLPSDQADLVAQVLSLTPEQISALPSDRQSMVAGIKQQYA